MKRTKKEKNEGMEKKVKKGEEGGVVDEVRRGVIKKAVYFLTLRTS